MCGDTSDNRGDRETELVEAQYFVHLRLKFGFNTGRCEIWTVCSGIV